MDRLRTETNPSFTISKKSSIKRDLVYAKDLALFLLKALDNQSTGIFNIATGTSVPFASIVEMCSKKLDAKYNVTKTEDVSFDLAFDIGRLDDSFGNFPWTSLGEALEDYL